MYRNECVSVFEKTKQNTLHAVWTDFVETWNEISLTSRTELNKPESRNDVFSWRMEIQYGSAKKTVRVMPIRRKGLFSTVHWRTHWPNQLSLSRRIFGVRLVRTRRCRSNLNRPAFNLRFRFAKSKPFHVVGPLCFTVFHPKSMRRRSESLHTGALYSKHSSRDVRRSRRSRDKPHTHARAHDLVWLPCTFDIKVVRTIAGEMQ